MKYTNVRKTDRQKNSTDLSTAAITLGLNHSENIGENIAGAAFLGLLDTGLTELTLAIDVMPKYTCEITVNI